MGVSADFLICGSDDGWVYVWDIAGADKVKDAASKQQVRCRRSCQIHISIFSAPMRTLLCGSRACKGFLTAAAWPRGCHPASEVHELLLVSGQQLNVGYSEETGHRQAT